MNPEFLKGTSGHFRSEREENETPLSKLLNDSEPMVIKQFDPKEGALEVAEKVLSSCFLNLLPLP